MLESRKLQLLILFCLGFFVVSITIIRMPVIIGDKSVQQARTLVRAHPPPPLWHVSAE